MCDRVLEDNAISKIGGYLHEAISELRVKEKQKNDRFLGTFRCVFMDTSTLICKSILKFNC